MSMNQGFSRRDFLRTAGAAGAGSILGVTGAWTLPEARAAQEGSEAVGVPKRPFGKTGVDVSILSLGGMFDIPSNQLLLKQAVRYGVTHWDTADCYGGGRSEEGIGEFFGRYPEVRKEIFVVTKSDSNSPSGMSRLLKRSLERMKTDYIDLYFLHGVRDIDELDKDVRRWVEHAKKQGRIKFFGFSTHSNVEECLTGAARLGWVDGIMMSYNFRTMHDDAMKRAVEACAKAGIGLTAMKTQGGGPVRAETETELEMAGRFLKEGFSAEQAKLKAVWEEPAIANICSQMPNLRILMDNIAAALNRTKLSAEDKELLRRYARETASEYCAGCSRLCSSAVEGEVPVNDVMRYLMYYRSYGERDLARSLYRELPQEIRSRLIAADFSRAERNCPRGLRIGELMKEATVLLA